MAGNKYSIGFILIGIALILLLGKIGFFSLLGHLFWPLLIFLAGLLLNVLYFGRIFPSFVLVPSGMLIICSFMFFYCNLFGWGSLGYLWPGFIFGIAFGLYELHIFDRSSPQSTFRVALVLAVISLLLLIITVLLHVNLLLIALLLMIIGTVVLLMRKQNRTWK